MESKNKHDGLFKEANILVTRYKQFTERANELFLRWRSLWFIQLPNLSGLQDWQIFLYDLSSFYYSGFYYSGKLPTRRYKSIIYFGWLLVAYVWFAFTIVLLSINEYPPPPQKASQLQGVIFLALLFVLVVLALLTYAHTIWFLASKRISTMTRMIWCTILISTIAYLYFMPNGSSLIIKGVTIDFTGGFFLVLVMLPLLFFFVFNLMYLGKFCIEGIMNSLRFIFRMNDPLPLSLIQELLDLPIGPKETAWKVLDLKIDEIKGVKEMAVSTLEASEKRTIPTIIMLAVIGFLGTTSTFQKLLSELIQGITSHVIEFFLPSRIAELSFGRYAADFGLVVILGIVFYSYARLFLNLIVQGVVIQSCVVAEYAIIAGDKSLMEPNKSCLESILKVFKSLLGRL